MRAIFFRLSLLAISFVGSFSAGQICCWAAPNRDEVLAQMQTYDGPATAGVDRSKLTGKIMAGYQGWFTVEGDGAETGWRHYSKRRQFRPGACNIDLWPDVSELDADEKFLTDFRHANGQPAYVFSSHRQKTVLRHFRWMKEYGIDGVFVQRFVVETAGSASLRHCNTVLSHCREGANEHGRCYALMYDLSGLRAGGIDQAIADWKLLVDRMKLGRDDRDRAYLRHNGKPVVAVWGIGFNDGRAYTLAECDRFVEFLKNDPTYGGNTVMVGIPAGWRTLDRDSITESALHATLLKADILSPWTVGRYGTPQAAARHAQERWQPDIAWCRDNGKEYMPVVFPGFSWHNMRPMSPHNQIPRLGGEFLWRQIAEAKAAGATMIYQAMFDELDEGTAIFKCTNDPPVGESPFVAEAGLPSDQYLWLCGQGGKLLRGEITASERLPLRPQLTDKVRSAAAKVTQIIAHRGASAERPENTLSSTRRAIEVGATAVEVDVRTTKDGHLVLMHDADLDHTTSGKGPLNQITLADLLQLDAGSHFDAKYRGERVATLEEVLLECKGRIDVLLDLKESVDAYHQQVVSLVRRVGQPSRTIVGVRSVEQAREFHRLLPEARQLGLVARPDDVEAYALAGVEMIRLWPRWLSDSSLVDRVRKVGVKLHLNGETGLPDEVIPLLLHSPDSLSSDNPWRLRTTLNQLRGDTPPR
jgi:glycerophosphoryl diester phosphodiesterase